MEIVFYFSWMEFSFCHRVNLLFTTHWKTFWGKIVIYAPLTSWSQFDRQRPLFLRSKHYVKMTGHSQVGYPTLFLHLFFLLFLPFNEQDFVFRSSQSSIFFLFFLRFCRLPSWASVIAVWTIFFPFVNREILGRSWRVNGGKIT